MTNMQHYMDDIQDLLDGLNEEMSKRLKKIEKWEGRINEKTAELKRLESTVFEETKPMNQRSDAARRLVVLKDDIRILAEKKTTLAEKNHLTVQKVYDKLSELAYHCKCEVEIDNPGCTEQREREFYKSLDRRALGPQALIDAIPGGSRKRESSVLTDDGTSTRSVTPFNGSKVPTKKGPGRPRNQKSSKFKTAHFDRIPENSAVSSTRSSVDPELRTDVAEKKLSKYMRKKQDRLRMEEEQRVASLLEIKKEVDSGDYEAFALNSSWSMSDYRGPSSSNAIASSTNQAEASTACVDLCEEDERDLLDCLNFSGLQSPSREMMEDMDVTESALYSMDMYPPDHKSSPEFRHPAHASASNSGRGTSRGAASSSQSYTQRSNNETAAAAAAASMAASSMSDSSVHVDKRNSGSSSSTHRNALFGSIPDTSFSGRPRKLTNRVSEMIAATREKNQPKKYREQEEWCVCNGANTNSEMMVECENKDCPIEWFHFGCVGLDAPPQDEWYCPECRDPSAHAHPSQLHI